MAIVVIDAGHGGSSKVGGSSPNNATGPTGLLEKQLTLDLARRVRKALQAAGVDVRLTRDTDTNLGLRERAAIARRANADAFVSIHFNGYHHPVQGTETWHHHSASSDSKALASLVQAAVLKATGLDDRGVKPGDWGVLAPAYHAPTTAACLAEVSFMHLADEESRLRTEAYKDGIASALAAAIEGWLIGDRRMAARGHPAAHAAGAANAVDPEAGFDDTYAAMQCEDADDGTAEPGPGQPESGAGTGGPPVPAITAAGTDLTFSIDFLADPLDRGKNSAAGVDDLGGMLRGWRKERLHLPEAVDLRPEASIGRDESLDAAFLELLAARRRAVGILRTHGTDYLGRDGTWSGTGFLVAPNILLTNHHVLHGPEAARAASVAFDYELGVQALARGSKDEPVPGRSYRLHPDRLFVTSPVQGGLDYTFVWIDDVQLPGSAPIRMERAAFTIGRDERAFIIHHPRGGPKRVSLDDTDVVTARPDGAVIHYTSDTERGSSGAPVFDRSARLIALHHASRANTQGLQTADKLTPDCVNEGIKMAAIALDLEARRGREASAMIDVVLGEFHGSDTLSGFFGAAGRRVDPGRPGATRVTDLYQATAQDVDIGFWNIASFAADYAEKVDLVAALVVDLGLDVWALAGSSRDATKALAETIERKFRLRLDYLHAERGPSALKQEISVLWNPITVDGEELSWPRGVDELFQLRVDAPGAGSQAAPGTGMIFDHYPALFRFRGLGTAGDGIDFNLVPLHLETSTGQRVRQRMAWQILARAVDETIARHGAERDWMLGGAFDAEPASADLDALARARFQPASAQDEAGGALSYIKSPRSHIDRVFLSPNMSRLYGQQDLFVLAKEKSQVDYLKRFPDHRPVLLRLAARGAGKEAARHIGPDPALAARIEASLRRARG